MLRKLTPYLFVAPLIIFITIFTYIPIITSINLSFTRHATGRVRQLSPIAGLA
jgi:ABC-type sugar transport system permease subunit